MASTSLSHLQVDNSVEDRISQLPTEILVSMLSCLPIKDAGRTSVLSGKWRNLWKLTTCLNFVGSEAALDELSGLGRSKFVMRVNKVLRLHERPYLDEFRVHFNLDASARSHIDEWMKFMILKRAKVIEVDLSHLTLFPRTGQYSPSPECCLDIKSPSNWSNVTFLRSLTLKCVDIDGEFVEYLLSKCPHLEKLSISYSCLLLSLKVAGPSLPLKYLKVYRCTSIQIIELSAPNLVTFIYSENPVQFVLGNNPLLSELYLGEASTQPDGLWAVTRGLDLFSSYFSQLETLSLTMALKDYSNVPEAGLLINLKHLTLAIHVPFDRCLLTFTKFIRAAPSLAKLNLELNVYSAGIYDIHEPRNIQPHKGLKEVEICWYYAGWCDFELARWVATVAVNLEKMVLDTRWHPALREMDEFHKTVQPHNMRMQVEELKEILAPQAELIVLR